MSDFEIKTDKYYGGSTMSKTPYVNGVKHGTEVRYYRSGEKLMEISYVNGKAKGEMIWYNIDGTMENKRKL